MKNLIEKFENILNEYKLDNPPFEEKPRGNLTPAQAKLNKQINYALSFSNKKQREKAINAIKDYHARDLAISQLTNAKERQLLNLKLDADLLNNKVKGKDLDKLKKGTIDRWKRYKKHYKNFPLQKEMDKHIGDD